MKKNKKLLLLVRKMAMISFKDGRVLEAKVKSFIKDIKKLPLTQAVFLIKEYLKALKMLKQRSTLVIESVVPLSQTQITKIKQELKTRQPVTDVEVVLNKNIIGGLKLRLGDSLYDDSILNRIYQIGGIIKA